MTIETKEMLVARMAEQIKTVLRAQAECTRDDMVRAGFSRNAILLHGDDATSRAVLALTNERRQ